MSDKNKTKKQLESELKELGKSEEKYRTLFINAPLSYQSLDEHGCFIYVNPAWLKTLGYKKEEVIGKWFGDFLHPDWKPHFKKNFPAFKKRGYVRDVQFKIRRKDGRYLDISFEGCIGYNPDGSFKQTYCMFQDITDRKKTEEKATRFSRIFEHSLNEIYLFDSKTLHFVQVNNAAQNNLGYTMEELSELTPLDLKPEFNPDSFAELVAPLREGKTEKIKFETVHKRKDGSLYDVEVHLQLLKEKQTSLFTAIILDITERKQAEENVKASLKEKEVMLQEIHHRVKNNMQIIVSLLRLQSNYAKDKKIEDMLKIARTRIHSMAAIHERLYRSKDFANINFALYIQGLTTHLMQTYQIDPKQITLKTDVKDINLDINKGVSVGLLLNELVSNALKHAFPKGKKGEVVVKFHADKKGQKTLIVSDNGIGHPDKVNISKPETLGMQLIKDLTTQINGKLELDNKAGTTFKITFA